jgi:hypothetical protein
LLLVTRKTSNIIQENRVDIIIYAIYIFNSNGKIYLLIGSKGLALRKSSGVGTVENVGLL